MNGSEAWVTEMIQRISEEACSVAEGNAGRLLVLAWAEDGVSSVDIFREDIDDQSIEYHFGSVELASLVLDFRGLTQKRSPDVWSGFALLIKEGTFSIDFFYQGIDSSFDSQTFRKQHVGSYLGNLPIRYPKRG